MDDVERLRKEFRREADMRRRCFQISTKSFRDWVEAQSSRFRLSTKIGIIIIIVFITVQVIATWLIKSYDMPVWAYIIYQIVVMIATTNCVAVTLAWWLSRGSEVIKENVDAIKAEVDVFKNKIDEVVEGAEKFKKQLEELGVALDGLELKDLKPLLDRLKYLREIDWDKLGKGIDVLKDGLDKWNPEDMTPPLPRCVMDNEDLNNLITKGRLKPPEVFKKS